MQKKPTLIFMGTPEFSAHILESLIQSKDYSICAVYTQPPKKAGRGQKVHKSPVHQCAERYDLPIETPLSLKTQAEEKHFFRYQADIAVVVAYGLILSEQIISAPKCGSLNIHTSLLPRWRGAAPIQHALLAGDQKTGLALMQMDQGLDTGPVYRDIETYITPHDTTGSLLERLQEMGCVLLHEMLPKILAGAVRPIPQASTGVVYASKITKPMARLDWMQTSDQLERQVRAFNPQPGAWFSFKGSRLKVFQAQSVQQQLSFKEDEIGTVLNDQFHIACRTGVFVPKILQRPGGNPLSVDSFLKGFSLEVGEKLREDDTFKVNN